MMGAVPAAANAGGTATPACLVCRAPSTRSLLGVDGRDYWRCETCDASFLDARQRPGRREEYDY
jgi:transposase-like protein